jgi:fatty-acid desaturase
MCSTTTSTIAPTAAPSSAAADAQENTRPWYRRGGMHVNEIGFALNIAVPVAVMAWDLDSQWFRIFVACLFLHYAVAYTVYGMRSLFCVVVVPTYLTSAFLCLSMNYGVLLYVLAVPMGIYKLAIPMSACFHRFSAHGAFKCGPVTRMCLGILGSTCIQGGPIWWASQHRKHHKFCDTPRDPHSSKLVGTENAFAFFMNHPKVDEEFAPPYLEDYYMRILDTWSFVVFSLEVTLSYALLGREGIYLTYTSAYLCQLITLWFNVCNHPPNQPAVCKAGNVRATPDSYYPAFWLCHFLYPLFGSIVQEDLHEDHHDRANLGKRCWWDMVYWGFLKPLELAGLIWDIKCFDAKKAADTKTD